MSETDNDPFLQFKMTFFEECHELLSNVEGYLQELDSGEFTSETLHAIFRAVHSVKAGAGAFSFERMVNFTHRFETLLDELRTERLPVDGAMVETLFRGFDVLSDLVGMAQKDEIPAGDYGDDALAAIESYLTTPAEGVKATGADTVEEESLAFTAPQISHYRIDFKPKEAMYRHANEPLLILRELASLGEIDVQVDMTRLPFLEQLEPEDAYLGWGIDLKTDQDRSEIDEVFEFVIDDCELTIVALGANEEVLSVDVNADDDDDGFGFFVDESELPMAPQKPIIPVEKVVPKDEAASVKVGADKPVAATKASSIRVDIDRVDRLVNMVGELVITQSMLAQEVGILETSQTSRVATGMEELSMHIRELQENVMAIRMQPVKSVFSRMPRIVRDVSKKLEKKVRLVTVGETTEVDKTVIEELADPLTHMIRNSLDHGLEIPAERVAAGKPEEGEIRLSAEHRGGRIIIQITDDGRGINRSKVLELAKERGLIADDADLSDEEVDNLIFAPGFSTADEVTDLSGRGVGMDVVRRNIQTLGGRVSVHSTPGKGSCFQLTLPLTLAVLDGMIVAVGNQKYVVPINNIVETIRPTAKELNHLVEGGAVMRVRGEYIRIVPVGELFGIAGAESDPTKGLVVLAEADGGTVVGLLVDQLAGQQQVVIKSLETNFKAVSGIASATILGDGSVCLILDIDRLAAIDPSEISKSPPKLSASVGHRDQRMAAQA